MEKETRYGMRAGGEVNQGLSEQTWRKGEMVVGTCI